MHGQRSTSLAFYEGSGFNTGTGFHKWLSTDNEGEDACISCGVVAPFSSADSVVVDFGPLPIWCPGPNIANAHHFQDFSDDEIRCAFCMLVVTPDTEPHEIEWECSHE